MRKTPFYIFLASLFVVSFASSVWSASWLDVVDWISANPAPADTEYWVEDIITAEGAGMRVWRRVGGSSVMSYERKKSRSINNVNPNATGVFRCDGSNTQFNGAGYWESQQGADFLYCDGAFVEGVWNNNNPRYIEFGGGATCYREDQFKNDCGSLDTLVHEVLGIVDDCTYSGVTPEGGLIYKDTINLGGGSPGLHSCYSCIPSGTVPRDDLYTSDGLVDSCFYERVTGDPATPAYSVTLIPSTGTGANDPVKSVPPSPGGPTGDAGTTTTETTTTDANGETYTTTSETTTGEDGTVTTTTTETLSGCVDVNADGFSDINGRACGSSTTTTATASTTKPIEKPVNPYGAFGGKTFADVWSSHSAAWMDTQVVGLINGMNVTLNKSLPCYQFNLGSWGNAGQFCLSDYAWIFDIIYYLNLLCAVYISRFIIFG